MNDARVVRERVAVLWIPNWPLHAALAGEDVEAVVAAVLHTNRVLSCTRAATASGVRRGHSRREAQGLAPNIRLLPVDADRDERAFRGVLHRVRELVPEVQLLRPGLLVARARGLARFYGDERDAATAISTAVRALGYPEVRVGFADDMFSAELAARLARGLGQSAHIVAPTASAAFLRPLPIAVLGDDELASLLVRLGIHTLGQFADLDEHEVRTRFGSRRARLHARARGNDTRLFQNDEPDPQLTRAVAFDTPLTGADQVAFSVRQTADTVLEALATAQLICTGVRVTLRFESGTEHAHQWLHPTHFTAAELVHRVRWQLEMLHETGASPVDGLTTDADVAGVSAVVGVVFAPTAVDDVLGHQTGLFGHGSDQRLHHALTRVQTMLGYTGVLTAHPMGSRWVHDALALVPWGERAPGATKIAEQPWPGRLKTAVPSEVYSPAVQVHIAGEDGGEVCVDARGNLTTAPERINGVAITAWSGPWPLHEKLWDPARGRHAHRFEVVDERQRAWLVYLEAGSWWAEGRFC